MRLLPLMTALSTLAGLPALGQSVTTSAYGEARGWIVSAMYESGSFAGCVAQPNTRADTLSIAYLAGPYFSGWQVWVPSFSTETYIGGGIAVDGRSYVDSQFGFGPDGAYAEVTETMIGWIAQGSTLRTQVGSEPAETWSLSGSAAAIGKIRECVDYQGNTASAAPSPTAPSVAPTAPSVAQAAPCPAPGSLASGEGVTPVALTFGNGRDVPIEMYWLDYSGQREFFARLMPGESVDIDTYAEHLWIALAPDGSCPGGVIAPEPNGFRYLWEIYAD